jgi:hypothetical protein
MSLFKKKIVIDPVTSNLVNRIAPGCSVAGEFNLDGGMLVQGQVTGSPMVVRNGPLLIESGGKLMGRVEVHGDVFVFGAIGDAEAHEGGVTLEVHGTLHVGETGKVFGHVVMQRLASYDGATINALSLKTMKPAGEEKIAQ